MRPSGDVPQHRHGRAEEVSRLEHNPKRGRRRLAQARMIVASG
jgi:hypothetical protein